VKFTAKPMSEIAFYDSKRFVKEIPFHLSIFNTDVILHVILNDDVEVLVCRCHIDVLTRLIIPSSKSKQLRSIHTHGKLLGLGNGE
jgi:hypothetical protein